MKKCSFLIKIEIRLKSEMSIFYSNRKKGKNKFKQFIKNYVIIKENII